MDDILKHWLVQDVNTLTDSELRRVVKLAATENCLVHLFYTCFESPLVFDV